MQVRLPIGASATNYPPPYLDPTRLVSGVEHLDAAIAPNEDIRQLADYRNYILSTDLRSRHVTPLKDAQANFNATSGRVPYSLKTKQSARRTFVFLKQIVDAMEMADTPQTMAPRVLESFVEKDATRAADFLLQSRHALARLRPDMYFKMPKCQNVGDSEGGDPKLATPKDTRRSEKSWIIGGGDRRWEHRLSLILA
jgi:hypothetical protein